MAVDAKRFLFRLTSYILVVTSGLHLVGHFAERPAPVDEAGQTLFDLMQTYHLDFHGIQRTMMDFLDGYSLSFATFAFFAGVLNLAILRFCAGNRPFLQTVIVLNILFSGLQLLIAVVYFIHPPMISFGLTLLGFSAAFLAPGEPEIA